MQPDLLAPPLQKPKASFGDWLARRGVIQLALLLLGVGAIWYYAANPDLGTNEPKGTLSEQNQTLVSRTFEDIIPGSIYNFRLYGVEQGKQLCAFEYDNGEFYAAEFPVPGTPLYAFYGHGYDTRYSSQTGKKDDVDTNLLAERIRACVSQAAKADYQHQPRVLPDD